MAKLHLNKQIIGNIFQFVLLIQLLWIPHSNSDKIEDKCNTCREIVGNFKKGLEKTAKNHFSGGDTAWEESRLGSYARSETRFLEILENVCKDAKKESRCHAIVEEYEDDLESFWFNKEKNVDDLEVYLCMTTMKVCCDIGKWGKSCKVCPGGSEDPCSGNGKCSGSGTRSGSGECDCDDAYDGDVCEQCNEEYYKAQNGSCLKCHESCESSCTNGTSKDCDECAEGYVMHEQDGCIDKNECEDTSICEEGKFCFNTKGSHRCHDCDPACKGGCTNSGRLSCNECNDGWKQIEGEMGCEDVNECSDQDDICVEGTYCTNTEGSFKCETCHKSCSKGCTGEGPKSCSECAEGYEMSDEGCIDVNQCLNKHVTCSTGFVCVNEEGTDNCHACHSSCMECTNTGEGGCLACHKGYMLEENRCKDIDECKLNKPCNKDTENCSNTPGSYKCKCKQGYVRTKKGDCKKKDQPKTTPPPSTPAPVVDENQEKKEL